MDARWAKLAALCGHDGAKMAPRWPSWDQFGSFLGGPGTTCAHFFRDLWKNGRSVKTNNTTTLLVVFWGLGPPLEGPGGCLGRILGAMLEDVDSKLVFSWLSQAMFGHLGAKVGEQECKMRQLSAKVGFLVAWMG